MGLSRVPVLVLISTLTERELDQLILLQHFMVLFSVIGLSLEGNLVWNLTPSVTVSAGGPLLNSLLCLTLSTMEPSYSKFVLKGLRLRLQQIHSVPINEEYEPFEIDTISH